MNVTVKALIGIVWLAAAVLLQHWSPPISTYCACFAALTAFDGVTGR